MSVSQSEASASRVAIDGRSAAEFGAADVEAEVSRVAKDACTACSGGIRIVKPELLLFLPLEERDVEALT